MVNDEVNDRGKDERTMLRKVLTSCSVSRKTKPARLIHFVLHQTGSFPEIQAHQRVLPVLAISVHCMVLYCQYPAAKHDSCEK
jgi:hypothetical protein